MKLTKYSEGRLRDSLRKWHIDDEFAVPMYNYLVFGFEPGGFFKGWYARDAMSIVHSHPSNSVEALKNLSKWMINCMPHEAWGSYEQVYAWIKMEDSERRRILEEHELIFTEEEETWKTLKGEPTVFYT